MGKYANHEEFGVNAPINYREDTTRRPSARVGGKATTRKRTTSLSLAAIPGRSAARSRPSRRPSAKRSDTRSSPPILPDCLNSKPIRVIRRPGATRWWRRGSSNCFHHALSIGDVDAGNNPVKVTLTATNGVLTLGGTAGLTFSAGDGTADGTMTFQGSIATINTALEGLRFTPPANFNGAAGLAITTNDLGNTGAGGPQSDSDTVAITVTPVNDAPVNTVPGAQVINEDTTLVFSGATGNALSIGDVDAGSNPVEVTLTATNGALTLGGTAGLTFSAG